MSGETKPLSRQKLDQINRTLDAPVRRFLRKKNFKTPSDFMWHYLKAVRDVAELGMNQKDMPEFVAMSCGIIRKLANHLQQVSQREMEKEKTFLEEKQAEKLKKSG